MMLNYLNLFIKKIMLIERYMRYQMSNKQISILISCIAMVIITILGYFVNITFIDKDNNDDYDNYTAPVNYNYY